ncbi:MAG: ABC transporter substrate-binding protein, partial [Rhodospirillales bacterium]|nr:ABC transporter substrate-binding protein [Rhodospirillales bacterium]
MLRRMLGFLMAMLLSTSAAATPPPPVYLGLDAEFGLRNSTSAQAIERGILIAIDQVNQAGGVLGGRPLALITRDH